MSADSPTRLRETVQDAAGDFGPDIPAILTGAVLVCEWAGDDGDYWVTWITVDARDKPLPGWRVRGLIGEVVSELDARRAQPDDNQGEDA